MKPIFKLSIPLIICTLIFCIDFRTRANDFSEIHSPEAVYDLEKGGIQSFKINDKNGKNITITIEEINSINRAANGDYKISYSSAGAWKAEFKVSISGNKITKAYSPSHVVITGKISGAALRRNSNTKATYSFLYTISNLTVSTGVKAIISNSQLVVSQL